MTTKRDKPAERRPRRELPAADWRNYLLWLIHGERWAAERAERAKKAGKQ